MGTTLETNATRNLGSRSHAAMAARNPAPPPPTTTISVSTTSIPVALRSQTARDSYGDLDQLVQPAKHGSLFDVSDFSIARKPLGNVVPPQIERIRFECGEYCRHRKEKRIERMRSMIVDDNQLPARLHYAQGFGESVATHILGLFMQQKEQQGAIVGSGFDIERGAVTIYKVNAGIRWQLAREIFQLNRQDIDDVQARIFI